MMKVKYKLFVKENWRLVDPVLFKIVGQNNELMCRVEGWNGNQGRSSEYRLFNGDFSDAGSAYRILNGGTSNSYAVVFGVVMAGEAIAYRVFFNDFKKAVRYQPSYTGGAYVVEETTLRVDALFQERFWLYDGKKEIARMKRTRFSTEHTYEIAVYDEEISINTIMGVYIGVLAAVGEQQGKAYDQYHHNPYY